MAAASLPAAPRPSPSWLDLFLQQHVALQPAFHYAGRYYYPAARLFGVRHASACAVRIVDAGHRLFFRGHADGRRRKLLLSAYGVLQFGMKRGVPCLEQHLHALLAVPPCRATPMPPLASVWPAPLAPLPARSNASIAAAASMKRKRDDDEGEADTQKLHPRARRRLALDDDIVVATLCPAGAMCDGGEVEEPVAWQTCA